MSLYLVGGQGAATEPAATIAHLPTARPRRYPSDTTDVEWQIMAGYLPASGLTSRGGRPVVYPRRDIVDAIRYVDHNSCVWRALPADFPPWPTVYHYFRAWTRDGTLSRLHNGLREQIRLAEGRHADPSAAVVDSQSVRAAESVAKTSRGYDAGKNVNGRKRHIAVDTAGLLLIVLVTAAGVQDRDAARLLLCALRSAFRASARCGRMAGTPGTSCTGRPPRSGWPSTSCASSPARSGSPPCHDAGSWNELSPGSTDAAARSATTNASPPTTPRWSSGRWSSS